MKPTVAEETKIILCCFASSGKPYAYFAPQDLELEPGDRVDVLTPSGEVKSITVVKTEGVSEEEGKFASKHIIGLTPEEENPDVEPPVWMDGMPEEEGEN